MNNSSNDSSERRVPVRLPTGIPGLDQVLHGGFIKGGVYLLLGSPGAGKTILANQILFHHVRKQSGQVLYVTLLAESHSRMMSNLRSMDYYNDDEVGKKVHYLSGYRTLENEGLKGFLSLLNGAVREHKATMLLVDGVSTISDMENTPIAFRKFLHELNSLVGLSGCTAFLLSPHDNKLSQPEHTMVDGILTLSYQKSGRRAHRSLEVPKFRGSAHLYGEHTLKITGEGVSVFPRIESTVANFIKSSQPTDRCRFKVPSLDKMLNGGLCRHSVTGIIGAAGTGKSIMGLKFLIAGAEDGEPGLLFGFYEGPLELQRKAERIGLDLKKWVDNGTIEVMWRAPLEHDLDELGFNILQSVKSRGIKRVLLDGCDGFNLSAAEKKQVKPFIVALALQLKALGVTLILVEESSLFQNHPERHTSELSPLNETLIYMRYFNLGNEQKRTLTIIKSRYSAFDPAVREIIINDQGFSIGEVLHTNETLLTGTPKGDPEK